MTNYIVLALDAGITTATVSVAFHFMDKYYFRNHSKDKVHTFYDLSKLIIFFASSFLYYLIIKFI
ncbi:hypothetical protein LGK97_17155 [Clostridium sp. CS001]|uniref:hypothetical protein n=1 Tax=Clostridium sp. CS001 TaxID=2880648 RepID=UPI001CF562C9|nr:hypothetical protein [Clostridium sp. CS001]MCB2291454.1 hypothetical protein [Clostridium sp. CS001]